MTNVPYSLHGVPMGAVEYSGDQLPEELLAQEIFDQEVAGIVDEALVRMGVTPDNTAGDEYRKLRKAAKLSLQIAAEAEADMPAPQEP